MTSTYQNYQNTIRQILRLIDDKIKQRLLTVSHLSNSYTATVIEGQRLKLSQDHEKMKNGLIAVIKGTKLMNSLLAGLSQPQREIIFGILAFIIAFLAVICGDWF